MPPLVSAKVPVQPKVKEVACNKAVVGLPPNVTVTLVSLVLVNAAGVGAPLDCHVGNTPGPFEVNC